MNAMATAWYTPEDLQAMPDGKRFELVDGDLVETNVGAVSSWVGGKVFRLLANFAEDGGLGTAWPADCAVQCFADDPARVRRPDTIYIGRDRYSIGKIAEGFLREVPDLVVEVLSPNDRAMDVERKVVECIEAGVRLVWVIDPETRVIRIERKDGTTAKLRPGGTLSGEDVVPGFSCRVDDLFPPA